jgi:hypothetical protein
MPPAFGLPPTQSITPPGTLATQIPHLAAPLYHVPQPIKRKAKSASGSPKTNGIKAVHLNLKRTISHSEECELNAVSTSVVVNDGSSSTATSLSSKVNAFTFGSSPLPKPPIVLPQPPMLSAPKIDPSAPLATVMAALPDALAKVNTPPQAAPPPVSLVSVSLDLVLLSRCSSLGVVLNTVLGDCITSYCDRESKEIAH